METKKMVMAAGALGVFAALAIGLYEPTETNGPKTAGPAAPTKPAPPKAQAPKGAEQTALEVLPKLAGEDARARKTALEELWSAFDGEGAKDLKEATREKLSASLIQAYDKTKEESPEDARFKESATRLLIEKVGGEAARGFAVEAMANGTDRVKAAAAAALLAPGALRGADVYAAALELARADVVPDETKPALLRRVLGRKADKEILALFQTDLGSAALRACAIELQNLHKPELMGLILSRLEAGGLLSDAKEMPWFSGKLLAEHVRKADKNELALALRVAKSRKTLARAAAQAIRERLGDRDPSVRRMVARLIPQAVGDSGMDPESGERILVARLSEESDPAVKGALEDSLAQVRLTRRPQEETKAGPAKTQ